MSKTDVIEEVSNLEVIHGGAKFIDANHKSTMAHSNRFSLVGLIVSYSTLHQMWEVITEKDGIEVSYRSFRKREIAEAFALNKLANGMKVNIKAIE